MRCPKCIIVYIGNKLVTKRVILVYMELFVKVKSCEFLINVISFVFMIHC